MPSDVPLLARIVSIMVERQSILENVVHAYLTTQAQLRPSNNINQRNNSVNIDSYTGLPIKQEWLNRKGGRTQMGLNISETLKAAREKIADENHWTTHSYAKSFDGDVVNADNKLACKWCLSGAVYAVAGWNINAASYSTAYYSSMSYKTIRFIEKCADGLSVPKFNDTHSHSEVISFLDECIVKAENLSI